MYPCNANCDEIIFWEILLSSLSDFSLQQAKICFKKDKINASGRNTNKLRLENFFRNFKNEQLLNFYSSTQRSFATDRNVGPI